MNDHSKMLLTIEEAAGLLSMGRTKVYEELKSGRMRSVKIGRSRRIARAELERWVDARHDEHEAA